MAGHPAFVQLQTSMSSHSEQDVLRHGDEDGRAKMTIDQANKQPLTMVYGVCRLKTCPNVSLAHVIMRPGASQPTTFMRNDAPRGQY